MKLVLIISLLFLSLNSFSKLPNFSNEKMTAVEKIEEKIFQHLKKLEMAKINNNQILINFHRTKLSELMIEIEKRDLSTSDLLDKLSI